MNLTRVEQARRLVRLVVFGGESRAPDGGAVEVRVRKGGSVEKSWYVHVSEIPDPVVAWSQDEDVWFGTVVRKVGGSVTSDLLSAWSVWADVDHESAVQRLVRFALPPTVVVSTGRGAHGYWRLSRPLDMSNPQHVSFLREVVHGIAWVVGGDPAVHDPARLLRLPGTYNPKYDPPRLAEIVHLDEGAIYRVEDLSRYRKPLFSPTRPETPDISVLPPRIQDLIRRGWFEGCGYRSRSEADAAVVTSMVAHGFSDDQIRQVFCDPGYGISSKVLEEGPNSHNYLSRTISRAKIHIASRGTVPEGPRVRGGPDGIEVLRGDGKWALVLDAPVTALARLVGDEEGYVVDVGGKRLVLRAQHFSSSREFKLGLKMAASWMGSDKDVQVVLQYLKAQDPPTKRAVRKIGWYDRSVIFPNMYMDENGRWIDDVDYVYVGHMADVSLRVYDGGNWEEEVAKPVLKVMSLVQHDEVTCLRVLGWFLATFAAPFIRDASPDHGFPLLLVTGIRESGKTTSLEYYSRMVGAGPMLHSAKDITPFALIDLLSSSNTLPVIFDEHRVRPGNRDTRAFFYTDLRHAYKGAVVVRGRPNLEVARYVLSAPVCVAGESEFPDDALMTRAVACKFESRRHGMDEKMQALPVDYFASGMYRHVLRRLPEIPGIIDRARKMTRWIASPRQRVAEAVWRIGLMLVDDIVRFDIPAYVPESGPGRVVEATRVVQEVVRIIAELVRVGRIRPRVDYKVSEQSGRQILWIAPALVVPAVVEYVARHGTDLDLPMSRDSILDHLKAASDSLVVSRGNVKWMGSGSVRAYGIDLQVVEEELGIPAEFWYEAMGG